MAETQTKTPDKEKADEKEPTFPVSQLISESRHLLGVSRHVAVGALYGAKDSAEMTREAAKKRVKAFLGKAAQEKQEEEK